MGSGIYVLLTVSQSYTISSLICIPATNAWVIAGEKIGVSPWTSWNKKRLDSWLHEEQHVNKFLISQIGFFVEFLNEKFSCFHWCSLEDVLFFFFTPQFIAFYFCALYIGLTFSFRSFLWGNYSSPMIMPNLTKLMKTCPSI